MAELARRHHLHDRGDGVGGLQLTTLRVMAALTGSSSTAAPRSPSTRTMSRSDRIPSMRPLVITSTAPILRSRQNLDGGRCSPPAPRSDLVTFGIENCTYRHCRLLEADRTPLTSAFSFHFKVCKQQCCADLVADAGVARARGERRDLPGGRRRHHGSLEPAIRSCRTAAWC